MLLPLYRKAVVEGNIQRCFEADSPKEKTQIRNKFYWNLIQLMFEILRMPFNSKRFILKRIRVENAEILNKIAQSGKGVIFISSHMSNWEWLAQSLPVLFPFECTAVYKPIKNKRFERFMLKARSKFGLELVSTLDARQFYIQEQNANKLHLFFADQAPQASKPAVQVQFFNKPTRSFFGPEAYARKLDLPVVFASMFRNKFGFYTIHIELLTQEPNSLEPEIITQMHVHALEKSLQKQKANWLWSHKRFK